MRGALKPQRSSPECKRKGVGWLVKRETLIDSLTGVRVHLSRPEDSHSGGQSLQLKSCALLGGDASLLSTDGFLCPLAKIIAHSLMSTAF